MTVLAVVTGLLPLPVLFMIASAIDIRPPAPMPWIARKAASSYMLWDMPQRIDPTTKAAIAKRKKPRRP